MINKTLYRPSRVRLTQHMRINYLFFLWFLTFVMVNDFYRLRVWFRHLVLLGCSCPAPSQTRSQAPEYAKWPKMAYSARIMPQSYILLLRPYYARNSAGRMCKGLVNTGKNKTPIEVPCRLCRTGQAITEA